MILEPPNRNPSARTSTPTGASRWNGKGVHTPSTARSPVSSVTPTLRRDLKGPKQGSTPNAPGLECEQDGTTPVRTLMTSNITPRSGSRKSRVESASSTPRSTPERALPTARPVSMIEGRHWPSGESHKAPELGAGASHTSRPERARSVVSNLQHGLSSHPVGSTQSKGSRATSPDNPPKFFHANDAGPKLQTRTQSQSPRLQPRFAGIQGMNGANKNDTFALAASPESGDEHPKFFYADRMPEATTPPPRFANGIVSSRPPLQTIFSSYQTTSSPTPRPPSPLKEEVLPVSRKSSLSKATARRHTRLVSNGSSDIKAPEGLVKGQTPSRRSSVNDPSRRKSQPQSPSTANFGFAHSRRSSFAMSDAGQDSGPSIQQTSTYAGPPSVEPPVTASPELVRAQSPSKATPGQSKLDHLNELAANARRERKVLDLEISNSSLLAINRTLETEMRKQKAELRQFRRLRSSGRFPSSTFSASSRFSTTASTNDELSPTSSADEDELDDDRFSNASSGTSDDTSFPDSTSLSPTLRNSSIPVTKKRRTRSFKVDLAGQRLLLLDSQRLNQSLKRCLGRTDELIADGKKALDYIVNNGEMANVGPRVLAPDDDRDGGDIELGRGLLSPGLDDDKRENPWERSRDVVDGWHLPEAGPPDHKAQDMEYPGADITVPPYGDTVEQEVLHNHEPEEESGLGIWSDRQTLLEAEVQANLDALLSDRAPDPDPDPQIPMSEDLFATYNDPSSPARSETETTESGIIPYEDPGIDTGGETSTMEDDGSESQASSLDTIEHSMNLAPGPTDDSSKNHAKSVDNESTESAEPRSSSPSKGLGGFLRMVGGSWGV
ncbi:MAG: hypothetical protein Q9168_005139 [Polycauliona sp. 1 TL-2023]